MNCFTQWMHTFHFYQQCVRFQFLHIPANTVILSFNFCFVLFSVCLASGVKWCLTVTSICVSLMTNDVQHLFMCFLVISIHATTWLNLENITLSERSQTQKVTYGMIPFT